MATVVSLPSPRAEELADEARRYLAAVDTFRALGAEPIWLSSSTPRCDLCNTPVKWPQRYCWRHQR